MAAYVNEPKLKPESIPVNASRLRNYNLTTTSIKLATYAFTNKATI